MTETAQQTAKVNQKPQTYTAKAFAAQSPTSGMAPFTLQRREPRPQDVQIEILYCGVCHSDIHQARDEWGGSIYPMVPGHEIVGRVIKTGNHVNKFKAGDLAGVGCFVDSCRECPECKAGLEQYCDKGMSPTYNGYEQDKKTPTQGGYSTQIVVDENYVLSVSSKLKLEGVAPLLCAGITTFSALRNAPAKAGDLVAVLPQLQRSAAQVLMGRRGKIETGHQVVGLVGLARQPALVKIGRQRVVAGAREAVGDPANLVVETPPLLNDDDPGPVVAGHRQVALACHAIRPGKVGHDTHRYSS